MPIVIIILLPDDLIFNLPFWKLDHRYAKSFDQKYFFYLSTDDSRWNICYSDWYTDAIVTIL